MYYHSNDIKFDLNKKKNYKNYFSSKNCFSTNVFFLLYLIKLSDNKWVEKKYYNKKKVIINESKKIL